jgi:hypothetical protein
VVQEAPQRVGVLGGADAPETKGSGEATRTGEGAFAVYVLDCRARKRARVAGVSGGEGVSVGGAVEVSQNVREGVEDCEAPGSGVSGVSGRVRSVLGGVGGVC